MNLEMILKNTNHKLYGNAVYVNNTKTTVDIDSLVKEFNQVLAELTEEEKLVLNLYRKVNNDQATEEEQKVFFKTKMNLRKLGTLKKVENILSLNENNCRTFVI